MALGPILVHGQVAEDLATYDDARLDRDLRAELNLIYKNPRFANPDAEVPVNELKGVILDALYDRLDDDTPEAKDISWAQLDAAMRKAHTTCERVVNEALAKLLNSGRRRDGGNRFWQQKAPPMVRVRAGLDAVKTGIEAKVRQTRR